MDLAELLRKIDKPSLRIFAGDTILRAIETISPANYESQLVEILQQKFGEQILSEKDIRFAILDALSAEQAISFCRAVGLPAATHAENCKALQGYFAGWSPAKSRKFISFFNLPDTYQAKTVVDNRPARECIEAAYGQTVTLKGYLHSYQKRVKDELVSLITGQNGCRLLVQMPTGSGKTFTALEAVIDLFRTPRQDGFSVWLVNSNELTEQALDAFRFLWTLKGDRPLEIFRFFKDFAPDFRTAIGGAVFTSFGKLYSALENPDHPAYLSAWHLIRNTRLLIVDEAHTSIAPTYYDCINTFTNSSNCSLIGLTATPGRGMPIETADLVRLYSGKRIEITTEGGESLDDPIGFLQTQGYLATIHVELLETSAAASGNDNAICKTLAENSTRNQLIIDQIKLAADAKLPTIIFACTLDHVFALKILCAAAGIECRLITGATPQASRIELLEEFRNNRYQILINLDLLSYGVDLPNVRRLIVTRPVGSPILYSQILGRALRGPKNGGQPNNTVITLKDNILNYPSANLAYSYFSDAWNNR